MLLFAVFLVFVVFTEHLLQPE